MSCFKINKLIMIYLVRFMSHIHISDPKRHVRNAYALFLLNTKQELIQLRYCHVSDQAINQQFVSMDMLE
ncbi:hypothetical protein CJP04_06765 [Klebsiella pneumoniae]|nr:hypothetical protein CJP04_06765 [Klebsiella pneumoniae]